MDPDLPWIHHWCSMKRFGCRYILCFRRKNRGSHHRWYFFLEILPVEYRDQLRFLRNCPPTPTFANVNTYCSLWAKCWLRGGVSRQFPRNLNRIPQNIQWVYNFLIGSILFPVPQTGRSHIINVLLAEFLVRTVNYGPSFFSSIYGPSAKRAGHKSLEKNEDP